MTDRGDAESGGSASAPGTWYRRGDGNEVIAVDGEGSTCRRPWQDPRRHATPLQVTDE